MGDDRVLVRLRVSLVKMYASCRSLRPECWAAVDCFRFARVSLNLYAYGSKCNPHHSLRIDIGHLTFVMSYIN